MWRKNQAQRFASWKSVLKNTSYWIVTSLHLGHQWKVQVPHLPALETICTVSIVFLPQNKLSWQSTRERVLTTKWRTNKHRKSSPTRAQHTVASIHCKWDFKICVRMCRTTPWRIWHVFCWIDPMFVWIRQCNVLMSLIPIYIDRTCCCLPVYLILCVCIVFLVHLSLQQVCLFYCGHSTGKLLRYCMPVANIVNHLLHTIGKHQQLR